MTSKKLVCGECVEEMRKIPTDTINTIITDPPFFLIRQYGSFRKKRRKKFSALSIPTRFFKDVFQECERVLKPDGHLLVFCDSITYPLMFQAAYEYFDKVRSLIWYKGRIGLGGSGTWRYTFEMILHAWNRGAYFPRRDLKDVIECPVVPEKRRIHPAQKPVKLVKTVIEPCTPPSGLVLDPFFGSGTTAIACEELGLNWIGIELDEEYFQKAKTRIANKKPRGSKYEDNGGILKCELCGNDEPKKFVWCRDEAGVIVEVVCKRCGCVVLEGDALAKYLNFWEMK